MTDELFYPPTFWKNKTWKALITSFLSLMLSHGGMFVWKGSKFKILKYFQEKYFSWLILKIFTKPKKCKLFLKNSIKLIKKFFLQPPGWKFFSSPTFLETRVLLFFGLKKASGPDCIPVLVLRKSEHELSYILAEFFSMYLKESCFPACWKVSFVVSVFKNDRER